jgi:dipeptidyl aminopeptidase/acylaminoacyl peptidase
LLPTPNDAPGLPAIGLWRTGRSSGHAEIANLLPLTAALGVESEASWSALQLTSGEGPDWAPRWSPDGKQIAFHSMRSGTRDIWVMLAGGGAARQVTSAPESDYPPVWSPDGREIAC